MLSYCVELCFVYIDEKNLYVSFVSYRYKNLEGNLVYVSIMDSEIGS